MAHSRWPQVGYSRHDTLYISRKVFPTNRPMGYTKSWRIPRGIFEQDPRFVCVDSTCDTPRTWTLKFPITEGNSDSKRFQSHCVKCPRCNYKFVFRLGLPNLFINFATPGQTISSPPFSPHGLNKIDEQTQTNQVWRRNYTTSWFCADDFILLMVRNLGPIKKNTSGTLPHPRSWSSDFSTIHKWLVLLMVKKSHGTVEAI